MPTRRAATVSRGPSLPRRGAGAWGHQICDRSYSLSCVPGALPLASSR